MDRFCSKCGNKINGSAKFCQNCGKSVEQPIKLKPKCIYCGADLKDTSKFCPICGKTVNKTNPDTQANKNVIPKNQSDTIAIINQRAAEHGIKVNVPNNYQTANAMQQNLQHKQTQASFQNAAQAQRAPIKIQAYPKKRKNPIAVLIPVIAIVLVATILFTGLITPGWINGIVNSNGGIKSSSTFTVDNPVAKAGDVTVDLGEWISLEQDTELNVTTGETSSNAEEGWQMKTYDISVGDLHQLDDFVEIRIPYDSSYFDEGQDPAKCLGAKYYDEKDSDWKDILFSVDTKAKELVIYTDHFSKFGAFYVKNEGKRNAYITSISYDFDTIDIQQLADSCTDSKYLAAKALDFGKKILDFGFDSRDLYAYGLDYFTGGSGNEFLSGAIKGSSKNWLTRLGYCSIAYNLMKMAGQDIIYGEVDKELALNTLHTAATTYITEGMEYLMKGANAGLAVYMSGVYVTGKMLNIIAQGAKENKAELLEMVYWHYLECYTVNGHKPMFAKDWRQFIIDLLKKYPDDPDTIKSEIDKKVHEISESFFNLGMDDIYEVASDLGNIDIRSLPRLYKGDKEKMINKYIAHLENGFLQSALISVQNYQIMKAEQALINELSQTKAFLNTNITVNIAEAVEGNSQPVYAGYTIRFAPLDSSLSKKAKKSWTGKLDANGCYKTKITLIGFALAGLPHQVQVFKPGDNPDTATPVATETFIIDMPKIDIIIQKADDITKLRERLKKYEGFYWGTCDVNVPSKGKTYHYEGAEGDTADIELKSNESGELFLMPFINGGDPYDLESVKWDNETLSGSATYSKNNTTYSWHLEGAAEEATLIFDKVENNTNKGKIEYHSELKRTDKEWYISNVYLNY